MFLYTRQALKVSVNKAGVKGVCKQGRCERISLQSFCKMSNIIIFIMQDEESGGLRDKHDCLHGSLCRS